LEKRALEEIELLNYPSKTHWIPERKTSLGEHIFDVAIVGAGQTGITLAFSLQREKVNNIIIFDEKEAGMEGPWLTHARMDKLLTPKASLGPDCDIPSLTARAWYQAKYGKEAWELLEFIPRVDWAEYLQWLKKVLHLPIVNETKVGAIRWCEKDNCFILPTHSKGISQNVYARKIILATGIEGSGEWKIPLQVKKNIPKEYYIHTSENINFEKFSGKKIAILGGGPNAFDNALLCSEHNAQEVHMFIRRAKLPNRHVFLWGAFVGFLKHYPDLSDANKWQFMTKLNEIGIAPAKSSVVKARTRKNLQIHFDSPWLDAKMINGKPTVVTPHTTESFDALIIATGWSIDLNLREELKELVDKIALWGDKFTPPQGQQQNNHVLLRAPYLGKGSTFMEKIPGHAPYISYIFNATGGDLLSSGFSAGNGIIGMKYGVKAIIYELTRQLFVEDRDYFFESLGSYNDILFEN